jgi:hypothetical protein
MFEKENVEYSEIFRFFFPQNEIFNLNWFFVPKPQTYYNTWKLKIVAKGCYWELGEHFGNTLGTLRKIIK